ncbi:unnamed protein product [Caretta caretta]
MEISSVPRNIAGTWVLVYVFLAMQSFLVNGQEHSGYHSVVTKTPIGKSRQNHTLICLN